jgi:hypothetical protein
MTTSKECLLTISYRHRTRICSTTGAFVRSPTESFVLAIKGKYDDEEAEDDGTKRADQPQRKIQQVETQLAQPLFLR